MSCNICGETKNHLIKNEGKWDVVRCENCSFVYVTPLPDERFLRSHYQTYLPADNARITRWRAMMEDIFRISLDLIEAKRVNGGGALLDVGCGYGFFMEAARQRGWRVFGVEPCAHARAYAASRSLEIDSEDLFARAFPPDMFDVVTLFYVLEHLPDPVGCLKEVYRVLKPGGTILLRLPHTTPIVKLLGLFGIPNKLYDVPSHLCDFSPLTIAVALRKTGFSDIKTFPGGATRPPKLSERVVSSCSGALADAVYTLSGDRLLLPGVSKTTIAKKTGSGNVQQ